MHSTRMPLRIEGKWLDKRLLKSLLVLLSYPAVSRGWKLNGQLSESGPRKQSYCLTESMLRGIRNQPHCFPKGNILHADASRRKHPEGRHWWRVGGKCAHPVGE